MQNEQIHLPTQHLFGFGISIKKHLLTVFRFFSQETPNPSVWKFFKEETTVVPESTRGKLLQLPGDLESLWEVTSPIFYLFGRYSYTY